MRDPAVAAVTASVLAAHTNANFQTSA